MNIKKLKFAIASALLLSTASIQAEESLWIYTKGTDTRPQGSYEFKLSDVARVGKGTGTYAFHDIRPEIEYGLTNALTIGAELFIFKHNYSVDDVDLGPMGETQGGAGGSFNNTQYAGYELALKYNVLSPYKDDLGLSLGLAYEHRTRYRLDGAEIDQWSIVPTVFVQKNWDDDKFTWALNWKTEFENRTSPGVNEEEIAIDVSSGISYRIAPKHFIGFEFRHQSDYLSPYNTDTNEYDDPNLTPSKFGLFELQIGTQHQNGTYVGPTYHYADKHWWFTTGILFQISGGGSEHSYNRNGKNYDEHEDAHIGFTVGYEF